MDFQVIILGAGGAGMMCAARSGNRGRSCLIIDHAQKIGGKILISGGGRCNFTNMGTSPAQYVSQNPHFPKSALSRYTPSDFTALVEQYGIAYHEKKLGQLFCDVTARDIVHLLEAECKKANVEMLLDTKILKAEKITDPDSAHRFSVETTRGTHRCESLVIATGGLSIPKIGATGLGYDLAKSFGLRIIPRTPALDGFTFGPEDGELCRGLSGVSVDCVIECEGMSFRENVLFTHSGLSGPAALQASLHWKSGSEIRLNLLPDLELFPWFLEKKRAGNRMIVPNLLRELLPTRFVDQLCGRDFTDVSPLPQVSEKQLAAFCEKIHSWPMKPIGTVGYGKAEVTKGGVDTAELSSKTLESKKVPGLYFIGEVVDVTGWLGGYNFQWAWASGSAAGEVV
ncbi:MAG: NAD(P)/FAD-dependent oxidoreductase [Cryobacterium sp.]|nr:NAD(P)/FAD-dependent oxidoreductase [Oligoflexia bacterium]